MRRLRRILLNAMTMLSLVLFVATVVLWVRSYWRWDGLQYVQPARPDAHSCYLGLASGRGGAGIGVGFLSPEYAGQYKIRRWHWGTGDRPPIPYAAGRPAGRWGFGHDSIRDPVFRWDEVVFPFWLPTALFASLPLARGALFVRRRLRVREGHCSNCGHDLRATPGRCPECGKIPAK